MGMVCFMNERSEEPGTIVIVLIVFVLLLFLAGGTVFVVFVRQQTLRERDMARTAEMEARMAAEQAHAEMLKAAKHNKEQADSIAAESAERGAELVAATPAEFHSTAIAGVLSAQAAAWNAGDLDSFMEHYWRSDDLTFSSAGQTTRGWSATLDRYRTKYPNRDAMGTLKFDALEIRPLGDGVALVLGRWHVDRAGGPLEGNFSLVLRRIDDRWLIIHDHTSLMPASQAAEAQ